MQTRASQKRLARARRCDSIIQIYDKAPRARVTSSIKTIEMDGMQHARAKLDKFQVRKVLMLV